MRQWLPAWLQNCTALVLGGQAAAFNLVDHDGCCLWENAEEEHTCIPAAFMLTAANEATNRMHHHLWLLLWVLCAMECVLHAIRLPEGLAHAAVSVGG